MNSSIVSEMKNPVIQDDVLYQKIQDADNLTSALLKGNKYFSNIDKDLLSFLNDKVMLDTSQKSSTKYISAIRNLNKNRMIYDHIEPISILVEDQIRNAIEDFNIDLIKVHRDIDKYITPFLYNAQHFWSTTNTSSQRSVRIANKLAKEEIREEFKTLNEDNHKTEAIVSCVYYILDQYIIRLPPQILPLKTKKGIYHIYVPYMYACISSMLYIKDYTIKKIRLYNKTALTGLTFSKTKITNENYEKYNMFSPYLPNMFWGYNNGINTISYLPTLCTGNNIYHAKYANCIPNTSKNSISKKIADRVITNLNCIVTSIYNSDSRSYNLETNKALVKSLIKLHSNKLTSQSTSNLSDVQIVKEIIDSYGIKNYADLILETAQETVTPEMIKKHRSEELGKIVPSFIMMQDRAARRYDIIK